MYIFINVLKSLLSFEIWTYKLPSNYIKLQNDIEW